MAALLVTLSSRCNTTLLTPYPARLQPRFGTFYQPRRFQLNWYTLGWCLVTLEGRLDMYQWLSALASPVRINSTAPTATVSSSSVGDILLRETKSLATYDFVAADLPTHLFLLNLIAEHPDLDRLRVGSFNTYWQVCCSLKLLSNRPPLLPIAHPFTFCFLEM